MCGKYILLSLSTCILVRVQRTYFISRCIFQGTHMLEKQCQEQCTCIYQSFHSFPIFLPLLPLSPSSPSELLFFLTSTPDLPIIRRRQKHNHESRWRPAIHSLLFSHRASEKEGGGAVISQINWTNLFFSWGSARVCEKKEKEGWRVTTVINKNIFAAQKNSMGNAMQRAEQEFYFQNVWQGIRCLFGI